MNNLCGKNCLFHFIYNNKLQKDIRSKNNCARFFSFFLFIHLYSFIQCEINIKREKNMKYGGK